MKDLLVALDHVVCKGTEDLQDPVAPRGQRVKNRATHTSDRCACV